MKFTIAHIFCGIGGKGLGAGAAVATYGDAAAVFETRGGIDVDPLACRDFEMLVGAPALCADVHELEPADVRRFLGRTAPDVIMMSPPCKGFSGLLSSKRAAEPRYQRMNTLMERALFLVCETWEVPPRLIFVENVPRIQSRGKDTIRRCIAIGHARGYAIAQGNHDCGELGGLAQHRRRYFQLWRHMGAVPQMVYQPPSLRVRACGEVLGPLPMPGDVAAAGPMHSIPRLSWRNWVRLALIPAGGDWRDLPGTLVDGEARRDKFRRTPVTPWEQPAETVTGPGGSAASAVADPRFGHVDKVTGWDAPVGTITRSPAPSSGGGAVADPRYTNIMQVVGWDDPARTVTGAARAGGGAPSVADPRIALPDSDGRHWNKYAVHDWNQPAATVTGTDGRVGSGAPSVADPRWGGGRLGVTGWSEPSGTVAGDSLPNNGRFSVADPRVEGNKPAWQRVAGVTAWTDPAPVVTAGAKIHAGAFQVADPRVLATDVTLGCAPRAGAYRVLRWQDAAATITGSLSIDTGAGAVADPRLDPDRPPPFGTSHTRWREAIGNAVPPPAAKAIGEQLLRALLLTALGVFALSGLTPVWVAPDRRAL